MPSQILKIVERAMEKFIRWQADMRSSFFLLPGLAATVAISSMNSYRRNTVGERTILVAHL